MLKQNKIIELKRVLIIEDDELVRKDLMFLLKMNNYDVFTASNGIDGLGSALSDKPDLILCDINMPGMNGYEVLKELQKNPTASLIPFLFLTARSEKDQFRKGMDLGADDYLTKPYNKEAVLEAVKTRLKRYAIIQDTYNKRLRNLESYVSTTLPHELRTPLTTIMLYSEILMNSYKDLPESELDGIFLNINKAGKRLLRIITNYLFFNELLQLEEFLNKPQGIEFNPNEAVKMTAEKIAASYNRKDDLRLDLHAEMIVMSVEFFTKLIEELIDNGFKFSDEGTKVEVSTETSEGNLILKVKNRGRGFTESEIKKIHAFSQFKRKEYEQQGIGLGLAIVMKIAALYGGGIEVKSTPGVDALITVSFPAGI